MNALLMKIQEHFIHDKIAVPLTVPRISRAHLLKRLAENLCSANATILNGRAGSGKTMLALDFSRHVGRALQREVADPVDRQRRRHLDDQAVLALQRRIAARPHGRGHIRRELPREAFDQQIDSELGHVSTPRQIPGSTLANVRIRGRGPGMTIRLDRHLPDVVKCFARSA